MFSGFSRKSIICAVLFCFTALPVLAKKKTRPVLVVSCAPISSIIESITGDKMMVSSLAASTSCPCEYVLKTSQLWYISRADGVVYINKNFDTFIQNAIDSANDAAILEMGSTPELQLFYTGDSGDEINWHIWLSINNIKAMLLTAVNFVAQIDPENKDFYYTNYRTQLEKFEKLKNVMITKLAKLQRPILLSETLVYMFANFANMEEVIRVDLGRSGVYTPGQISDIKNAIKDTGAKCVFVSSLQNAEKIASIVGDVKIVAIESENFTYDGRYTGLLYDKLRDMVEDISKCIK